MYVYAWLTHTSSMIDSQSKLISPGKKQTSPDEIKNTDALRENIMIQNRKCTILTIDVSLWSERRKMCAHVHIIMLHIATRKFYFRKHTAFIGKLIRVARTSSSYHLSALLGKNMFCPLYGTPKKRANIDVLQDHAIILVVSHSLISVTFGILINFVDRGELTSFTIHLDIQGPHAGSSDLIRNNLVHWQMAFYWAGAGVRDEGWWCWRTFTSGLFFRSLLILSCGLGFGVQQHIFSMTRRRVVMLQDGGYTGPRHACTYPRAGAKVKQSQSPIQTMS